MARLRKNNLNNIHNIFGSSALDWKRPEKASSLSNYLLKCSVRHLFILEREEDAVQAMTDITFFPLKSLCYDLHFLRLAWETTTLHEASTIC